jgi:UDP-N-acetylmuramoyl-L-alanyl-D-glutamate--2,6-diaminopimelate ligase
MNKMIEITTSSLAKELNGRLIGPEKPVKGIFTFLNYAKSGDVVIRHWIDGKGVEIANKKGVSCIITQNPREKAIELAQKLEIPLIITPKIEVANAFALRWAVKNFAIDSLRVVVTGTNGKSTTTHMIYSILTKAGYNTYTNTDAQSEFNTLIDPVIANQLAEFEHVSGEKVQAMVIEVSEVQGWLDKLMKDHAYLMTSAVDPNVLVITNVGLDHIGLVNSIEETFNEIYGSLEAISSKHVSGKLPDNGTNNVYAILNSDDQLLIKMEDLITKDKSIKVSFYGSSVHETLSQDVILKSDGIYVREKIFLKMEELPFKSKHFIQNTMAAIGATLALNIDFETIKRAISSYKPLERRFTVLGTDPLIIDDFAHNPDGIIATIKSAAKMCKGVLYIVFAIRGSRGEAINRLNAEALVKGLEDVDYNLIVTSSAEEVDNLNIVKIVEKNVVLNTLTEHGVDYVFKENLYPALNYSYGSAEKIDTMLLIGAQGMDPASKVLMKIVKDTN